MMNLKVVMLLFFLQECTAIDASSPCLVSSSSSSSKIGPLKSSNVNYDTMYFERINLAAMKSVVTQNQATLSSCAVLCSNRALASSESCNIYFVEAGRCSAGVIENPNQYALQPGSSPSLVSVNVNVKSKTQNLGELVQPINGTASSLYPGRQVSQLWDGIIGYNLLSFATINANLFEYVQLDFGSCDLTFVQFVIVHEPQSKNLNTISAPSRSANLEIRVGNLPLTDNGKTRSTNPLCFQLVGTPPPSPVQTIFKCRNQLKGRYVTIQHFNGKELIAICEVYSYAF